MLLYIIYDINCYINRVFALLFFDWPTRGGGAETMRQPCAPPGDQPLCKVVIFSPTHKCRQLETTAF